MLNLTIDFGNSAVKLIVFDNTDPVYRYASENISVKQIQSILRKYNLANIIISSVTSVDNKILRELKSTGSFQMLNSKTKLPINNRYKTPDTLGTDRLCNAVAGSFLFPRKNVLIIDTGTCLKLDFIDAKKNYLGGSISPGLAMRFTSLYEQTAKLPLIHYKSIKFLNGKSTEESILSGVVNGMTEEIKGMISRYRKIYKGLNIILTGGDSARFERELNLSIFAAADLVNIGLNEIIRQK